MPQPHPEAVGVGATYRQRYLDELRVMRATGRHPDDRRIGTALAPRIDRIIDSEVARGKGKTPGGTTA